MISFTFWIKALLKQKKDLISDHTLTNGEKKLLNI